MAKRGDYQIPFSRHNGEMLHYDARPHDGDKYVRWEDNHVFTTTLTFTRWQRGRSAAHALMTRDDNGQEVVVFLTDFTDMLQHMVRGRVASRSFTYTKRGANYGVRLKDDEK